MLMLSKSSIGLVSLIGLLTLTSCRSANSATAVPTAVPTIVANRALSSAQTAALNALNLPIVVPSYLPNGFWLDQVDVDRCDAAKPCRGGSTYRLVYRDDENICLVLNTNAVGAGGGSDEYQYPVPTDLFGEVLIMFGRPVVDQPPTATMLKQQLDRPQLNLTSFPAKIKGAKTPLLYNLSVSEDYYRQKYNCAKNTRITPLELEKVVKSLVQLSTGAATGTAAPAQSVPAQSAVQTFGNDRFFVQAPAHWQMLDAQSDAFILTTPKPKMASAQKAAVKIDFRMLPQSLEAAANSPIGEDTKLVKTEQLTIDGHKAIRQYLAGGEFFDRAILTYIDNGKGESAYAAGFYYALNPKGAADITAIQNTFKFR